MPSRFQRSTLAVGLFVLLVLPSWRCLADQEEPFNSEPFALASKDEGNGKTLVQIKLLQSGLVVPIGYRIRTVFDENNSTECGVDERSIRVCSLDGKPPLLHISWENLVQGQGCYQNRFYIVCPKDDPTKTLVRGIVAVSGRWGWGTGQWGGYEVLYSGNRLCIRQRMGHKDRMDEPAPLYHPVKIDGKTYFTCCISTVLTRVSAIENGQARLESALLEYTVQNGDTVEDICKVLNVQESWILNAPLLKKGVSTLQIELPKDAAEKSYPTIQEGDGS